jgi:hypothetical protein
MSLDGALQVKVTGLSTGRFQTAEALGRFGGHSEMQQYNARSVPSELRGRPEIWLVRH